MAGLSDYYSGQMAPPIRMPDGTLVPANSVQPAYNALDYQSLYAAPAAVPGTSLTSRSVSTVPVNNYGIPVSDPWGSWLSDSLNNNLKNQDRLASTPTSTSSRVPTIMDDPSFAAYTYDPKTGYSPALGAATKLAASSSKQDAAKKVIGLLAPMLSSADPWSGVRIGGVAPPSVRGLTVGTPSKAASTSIPGLTLSSRNNDFPFPWLNTPTLASNIATQHALMAQQNQTPTGLNAVTGNWLLDTSNPNSAASNNYQSAINTSSPTSIFWHP